MAKEEKAEVVDEKPVDEVAATETQDSEVASSDAAEVEAPVRTWRDELGDEYSKLDDSAAIARIKEQVSRAQQADQYQQAATQWQQLYGSVVQQAQRAQAQPQAPAPKAEPKWKAPDYDPSWLDLVTRDEQGNIVPKPGAMPDLPAKIQQYAKWKSEQERNFYQDPANFVLPLVQEPIQQMVQNGIQQALVQYQVTNQVADWERSHLQVLTSDSQMIRQDGSNLSQLGQRIIQEAKQLQQYGVSNPHAALEMAYDRLYGAAAAAELQRRGKEPPKPETNGKKREDALRSAAEVTKPARNGAAKKGAPVIERKSVKDRLKENFAAIGLTTDEENE